jgi:hypothetical protein
MITKLAKMWFSCGCLSVFWLSGELLGQTVQLPELHFFSTSGSVLVPDRGHAAIGGVSRSASRVSRQQTPLGGPFFGNRSADHFASRSQASVHATIIDLEEMDRQVLGQARRNRREFSPEQLRLRARASYISQHIARNNVHPSSASGSKVGLNQSPGATSGSRENRPGRLAKSRRTSGQIPPLADSRFEKR